MSGSLTRIAASGASKTRYVTNCAISALFRGDRVLLLSLDPARDPYSAEIGNLGGRTHHPDWSNSAREDGSVGANLLYVCWMPVGRDAVDSEAYTRLLKRIDLRAAAMTDPISRHCRSLIIVDACQCLDEAAVSGHAAQIRQFVRNCADGGHTVIVAGENEWDTDWLDAPEAAPQAFARGNPEDSWLTISQQLSLATGRY